MNEIEKAMPVYSVLIDNGDWYQRRFKIRSSDSLTAIAWGHKQALEHKAGLCNVSVAQ